MTDVQITHPASDGRGTSIIIDGVEMRDSLSGFEVEGYGGTYPTVRLSIPAVERQRMCMKDVHVVLDRSTAEMLERAGWTPPEGDA